LPIAAKPPIIAAIAVVLDEEWIVRSWNFDEAATPRHIGQLRLAGRAADHIIANAHRFAAV
jgi:hypothetical protein